MIKYKKFRCSVCGVTKLKTLTDIETPRCDFDLVDMDLIEVTS